MDTRASSPPDPATAPPVPVAEIERRLGWHLFPALAFLGLMLLLGGLAAWSLLAPPRLSTGLPAGPGVAVVRDSLFDRLPMRVAPLRFRSALTGEAPADLAFRAADAARMGEARRALMKARLESTTSGAGDVRFDVALAHLELAGARYVAAEDAYRAVLDRGVESPEARLGIGVALARQADTEADPQRARGLRLGALAQVTAVDPRDAVHPVALYDRAMLLAAVGRRSEAGRVGREYLARDSASAWARRLREEIGIAPR